MEQSDKDALDAQRTYIDGKMKRYNLLFAVNGGAFVIARLLGGSDGKVVLGGLTLSMLAWGAILFTAVMMVDIWLFGQMMRNDFIGTAFGVPGKIILLLLGSLIIAAWALAGLGGVDVEAERAAIREADNAWLAASEAQDLERTLSFWADDALVFPPGVPLLEVPTQDDKPFLPAALISFVNRQVEVRGREDGTKFYLLGISSLTD